MKPFLLTLLKRVRDRLRTEARLDGILTIDVDIDLEEMDAASQSFAFAVQQRHRVHCPRVGNNLGVSIEVGSVLEALDDEGRKG